MENVIPLNAGNKKYESFNVYGGVMDENTGLTNEKCVGVAFLKGGSKVFSLRLWMLTGQKYFVAPNDSDSTKYEILSLEEYTNRHGDARSNWRDVGSGRYVGNFVELKFSLLEKPVYLSLFPKNHKQS